MTLTYAEERSYLTYQNSHNRGSAFSVSTVDEICDLFEKKDLESAGEKKRVRSSLTKQLDEYAAVPDNPFMDYFKFDGKVWGESLNSVGGSHITKVVRHLERRKTLLIYLDQVSSTIYFMSIHILRFSIQMIKIAK